MHGERQKGNHPCPLDLDGELPLMSGASPGYTPWKNLAPLGNEIPEDIRILVIDLEILVFAEPACLLLEIGSDPWV